MVDSTVRTHVLIVGAGPAGLAAAIRLKQKSPGLAITVVERPLLSAVAIEGNRLGESFETQLATSGIGPWADVLPC